MKRHTILIIAITSLLLLASSLGAGLEIDRHAFTGGGGRLAGGSYTLDSAIGQPVVA